MTEPTDKELEAFAIEEQFLLFCDVDEFTQIARAVLAKWGTPKPAPAVLQWTQDIQPTQGICNYDHCTAQSPLGPFRIEWKSWKERDARCLYLNGEYLGVAVDTDAAKLAAQRHIESIAAEIAPYCVEWREGRDFMFNKRAAVPSQAPIDMVLHCPKCGHQHIDEDNSEEIRIEAAELGIDREGDRELERWIEEREWTNPPHRSHQCQNRKCGHIWRPADVPTNGVAAIKTAGTKDDPITSPSVEFQILKAEHDNLKSSYGRLKLAYDAWHEKTNWIYKTIKPAEFGQHIADVMTARLQCLGDETAK